MIAGPGTQVVVSSKKEKPHLILLKVTENAVNNNADHLKHNYSVSSNGKTGKRPYKSWPAENRLLVIIFGGMTRYTFAPSESLRDPIMKPTSKDLTCRHDWQCEK